MSTIIFVHGMYMTGASWRPWQDAFEARGHRTPGAHPRREAHRALARAVDLCLRPYAAAIDFAAERPPLLLVAGEQDHIMPAALDRKNHARYAASPSRTDLKVFAERTHWICMMHGWQEVAAYVAEWLDEVGATGSAR